MKIFSFRAPERDIEMLDKLVERGLFKSRGDAIRAAIRKLLEETRREGRV
jgi:Arc/MetJ-type ribon-helix-helix transcriptional regulator